MLTASGGPSGAKKGKNSVFSGLFPCATWNQGDFGGKSPKKQEKVSKLAISWGTPGDLWNCQKNVGHFSGKKRVFFQKFSKFDTFRRLFGGLATFLLCGGKNGPQMPFFTLLSWTYIAGKACAPVDSYQLVVRCAMQRAKGSKTSVIPREWSPSLPCCHELISQVKHALLSIVCL